MPEHEFWITNLFNQYLGGLANAALGLVGMQAEDPSAPWSNAMVMQIVVAAILVVLALLLRPRLSVDRPGRMQHVAEVVYLFLRGQSDEIVGPAGRRYVPLFATIFLFVLACNLLGTFPTLETPTLHPQVPLGCAIVAIFYYHALGIMTHGPLAYVLRFMGPVPWLAFLMFPIEVTSHLARFLSLTVRLFANMFAGENIFLVFLGLTYVAVPAVFAAFHIFESLIQAYIFALLTMVYVGEAVAHEH